MISLMLLAGISASADLIRPPNYATKNLTGAEAEEMFETMGGVQMRGDSLRTLFSVYKVERSADGLKQVICEKTVYTMEKKPRSYRCTIQKSLDGKPLPRFKPAIRMG